MIWDDVVVVGSVSVYGDQVCFGIFFCILVVVCIVEFGGGVCFVVEGNWLCCVFGVVGSWVSIGLFCISDDDGEKQQVDF